MQKENNHVISTDKKNSQNPTPIYEKQNKKR